MVILLILFLISSIAGNIILVWYTRKLVQNLYYGVNNIDEMQKLLEEYASLLEPLANSENYYGDQALSSAIANTKLIIQTCRVYKSTLLEGTNEETEEIEEAAKKAQESNTQTGATIGPIR